MGFIKKLIFPLILMVAVVGGAIAADAMRSGGTVDPTAGDASHESGKNKSNKNDDSKGKDKTDGEGSSGDNVSYMKFKRQFVVPVMRKGKIDALVIMNLNLELNEKAPDNVYSLEPKLRDAITRELLSLSNNDVFGDSLTSAETYETLRATLLTAAKEVMPEGIRDVLILDVARQEQ